MSSNNWKASKYIHITCDNIKNKIANKRALASPNKTGIVFNSAASNDKSLIQIQKLIKNLNNKKSYEKMN